MNNCQTTKKLNGSNKAKQSKWIAKNEESCTLFKYEQKTLLKVAIAFAY